MLLREVDLSGFLGNKYFTFVSKILQLLLSVNDKRTLSVKGILFLIKLHTKKEKFYTTVVCQVLELDIFTPE